jgi:hypothetical protein
VRWLRWRQAWGGVGIPSRTGSAGVPGEPVRHPPATLAAIENEIAAYRQQAVYAITLDEIRDLPEVQVEEWLT